MMTRDEAVAGAKEIIARFPGADAQLRAKWMAEADKAVTPEQLERITADMNRRVATQKAGVRRFRNWLAEQPWRVRWWLRTVGFVLMVGDRISRILRR